MTNNKNTTRTPAEILRELLTADVRAGENAQTKLAAALTSDGLHALKWAGDAAEAMALGNLASEVLAGEEHATLAESLTDTLRRVTNALMGDHLTGSSSSKFANATEHHTRAAYAKFHRRYS